jgi:hypothetical protein
MPYSIFCHNIPRFVWITKKIKQKLAYYVDFRVDRDNWSSVILKVLIVKRQCSTLNKSSSAVCTNYEAKEDQIF